MRPAETPSLPTAIGSPAATVGGGETLAARSFQHYQVLRREDGGPWELGRGTMGITYKALDTNLRSEVALKVVNSTLIDHPNARERFVREARAAAALRHRNVASVYHLGNDGEHFFYAMEFIDGETLDALVRRDGPLPVGTALRLTLQVALALGAAARQKLVHRDIKPANLMVVHEDADEHMVLKVIDFGLARPTAEDGDADGGGTGGAGSLTIHGFVGTPQYASPEQLEERTLDTRSDIYSLGVTLWFLLAGKPPFSGSLAGICNQHLSKPPPWETLPASVPEPVCQLLGHLLEKDPARRPLDAVELRREIEDCLAALETTAIDSLPRGESARQDGLTAAKAFDAPEIGLVLNGRFKLTRLVGEGSGGRVFEARDRANPGAVVAVKLLRNGHEGKDQDERDRLREDARLVIAAPHKRLARLLAFEQGPGTGKAPAYVAEEWLDGFTLRDLLAARSGTLPPTECLRLLGQVAEAADHALSRRLERLELAIHQIHLHFPTGRSVTGEEPNRRAFLQASLEEWPREWSLKIQPFGVGRDAAESGTWAGEVTLLPGGPLAAAFTARQEDEPTGAAIPLSDHYLQALARLACELLGGHPLPVHRNAVAKKLSLPSLSEAGNAVLGRALSDSPGFPSVKEFVDALSSACGFNPETLTLVAPGSLDPFAVAPLPATIMPVSPQVEVLPVEPLPNSTAALTSLAAARAPEAELATGGGNFQVAAPSEMDIPAVRRTLEHGAGQSAGASAPGARASRPRQTGAGRMPALPGAAAPTFPDAGGTSAFPGPRPRTPDEPPDPWRSSGLAQLLEEEEARKLVAPGGTTFGLLTGAVLGLILLLAGFAVLVWRHEQGGRTPVKTPRALANHASETSARGSQDVSRADATPPPLRPAKVFTPPPLAATARQSAPITARLELTPPLKPAATPSLIAGDIPLTPATSPPSSADLNPVERQSPVTGVGVGSARHPDPTPRFDDRQTDVQIKSEPPGAEVFLQGAALGKAPMTIKLPSGDYQFVSHYRNWPEVRTDLRLADGAKEAAVDIRAISPSQIPLGTAFAPAQEREEARARREHRAEPPERDARAPRALPVGPPENAPVARALPLEPAPVPRARPPLEPFATPEGSDASATPRQANQR